MIMPFGVPRKTNQTAQPTSGCSGNEGADEGGRGCRVVGLSWCQPIPLLAKAKVMGSAPLAERPIVDDWSCPLQAVSMMPLP